MPADPNQMKTFDARKLMEVAVQVMRESIPEDRGDKKVPPAVGAVIWIPDEKRFETAYRGELRDGDHGDCRIAQPIAQSLRENRQKYGYLADRAIVARKNQKLRPNLVSRNRLSVFCPRNGGA